VVGGKAHFCVIFSRASVRANREREPPAIAFGTRIRSLIRCRGSVYTRRTAPVSLPVPIMIRRPVFVHLLMSSLCWVLIAGTPRALAGTPVQTPYGEQRVVFDFYFDDPHKIDSALYWIRSLLNPLMEAPYNYAPEFLDIVVVIHGTEIVTTVKRNYEKYRNAVERMKYYASLGVKFRVCGLAAHDYGYAPTDFQDFVEIAPSAITELAHWQLQGYALIAPKIMDKKFTIEEIR
jgi:uncharacterized protein